MATISVIIPCFNHGAVLHRALESVYTQKFEDCEIIIVDDGSTDPATIVTLDRLEQNNRLKLLRQANSGPSIARNNAIKLAKGKYLLLLDSDNTVDSSFIKRTFHLMESDKNFGVVYTDYRYAGRRSDEVRVPDFDFRTVLLYNYIDTCTLIRKEAFDSVGGFDEHMSRLGLEDWELWIAMAAKGWKFHHIPEVLFTYYTEESSRTFRDALKNQNELIAHVASKHSLLYRKEFEKMFYEIRYLQQSPDFRIGGTLLKPYRLLKKIFSGR